MTNNNENYDKHIEDLTNRVNSITETQTKTSFFTKLKNINKYVYMAVAPVIITIILILIKPKFLTKKVKDEKTKKENTVLDYTKIIIMLIIMVALVFGADYLINKKFKKSIASSS
jgi:hypothetical protein